MVCLRALAFEPSTPCVGSGCPNNRLRVIWYDSRVPCLRLIRGPNSPICILIGPVFPMRCCRTCAIVIHVGCLDETSCVNRLCRFLGSLQPRNPCDLRLNFVLPFEASLPYIRHLVALSISTVFVSVGVWLRSNSTAFFLNVLAKPVFRTATLMGND